MINWDLVFGCGKNGEECDVAAMEILAALRNLPGWPDPDMDPESVRYMLLETARLTGQLQEFTEVGANAVSAVNAVINSPKTFVNHPHPYEKVVIAFGGGLPSPEIYEAPDLAIVAKGHLALKKLLREAEIEYSGDSLNFSQSIAAYVCGLAKQEHLLGLPEVLSEFDCGDELLDQIRLKNARDMASAIRNRVEDFDALREIEDPETYSALRFADIEDYANAGKHPIYPDLS